MFMWSLWELSRKTRKRTPTSRTIAAGRAIKLLFGFWLFHQVPDSQSLWCIVAQSSSNQIHLSQYHFPYHHHHHHHRLLLVLTFIGISCILYWWVVCVFVGSLSQVRSWVEIWLMDPRKHAPRAESGLGRVKRTPRGLSLCCRLHWWQENRWERRILGSFSDHCRCPSVTKRRTRRRSTTNGWWTDTPQRSGVDCVVNFLVLPSATDCDSVCEERIEWTDEVDEVFPDCTRCHGSLLQLNRNLWELHTDFSSSFRNSSSLGLTDEVASSSTDLDHCHSFTNNTKPNFIDRTIVHVNPISHTLFALTPSPPVELILANSFLYSYIHLLRATHFIFFILGTFNQDSHRLYFSGIHNVQISLNALLGLAALIQHTTNQPITDSWQIQPVLPSIH